MILVVASVFGHPVPCDSRFLVVMMFALVAGLASKFIGGTASAMGKGVVEGVPVSVGAVGGIAAFLITLTLGTWFFVKSNNCVDQIQHLRLLGHVVDSGSQPIAGASVTVDGYDFLARSDASGGFDGEFGPLKRGTFIRVRVT